MKLLIVLLAILFGVWLWRRGRKVSRAAAQQKQLQTEDMVACAHCGLHVPRSASVAGRQGNYCCAAHQRRAEN